MSMTYKLQVRLPDSLLEYVRKRADKMDFTPSMFIRFLIIKDKESAGDDRLFWREAVDKQISEMNARIKELQQVKIELEKNG